MRTKLLSVCVTVTLALGFFLSRTLSCGAENVEQSDTPSGSDLIVESRALREQLKSLLRNDRSTESAGNTIEAKNVEKVEAHERPTPSPVEDTSVEGSSVEDTPVEDTPMIEVVEYRSVSPGGAPVIENPVIIADEAKKGRQSVIEEHTVINEQTNEQAVEEQTLEGQAETALMRELFDRSEPVRVSETALASDACTYFAFKEHVTYPVTVSMFQLTDIAFERGEKILNLALGDTLRYDVSPHYDKGKGAYHLYVKAMTPAGMTNLVVQTDRRNYHIMLAASPDTFDPMIAWTYQEQDISRYERQPMLAGMAPLETGNFIIKSPDKLNFGYTFGKAGAYTPLYVFDDGANTYIAFDPDVIGKLSPAVLAAGDTETHLLEYGKSGSNLVLEGVYTALEVRLPKKTLNIVANRG